MKYEDIKDFNQRCEKHPGHQTGMVSYQMIQQRLSEEIDELREYIKQRTWVGLTPEQVAEFETWHDNREEAVGWCNPSEIVAYIEAKLKEKNT
jgi:hypothetical protein